MVDSRGKIQDYDSHAKNTGADNESTTCITDCVSHEYRDSDKCGDQPNAVAYAVGNLFGPRLLTLLFRIDDANVNFFTICPPILKYLHNSPQHVTCCGCTLPQPFFLF